MILPTGIYSDLGTKDFREELLFRGRLDFLTRFKTGRDFSPLPIIRSKQTVILATKVAERNHSERGFAWESVIRRKPTRFPTISY